MKASCASRFVRQLVGRQVFAVPAYFKSVIGEVNCFLPDDCRDDGVPQAVVIRVLR